MNPAVSLVWLLEDDPTYFFEHYSACSQQVITECIDSVQALVTQAECKLQFVQPLLLAWSDMLQSAPANPQQTTSAIRHLPTQMPFSPLPMATSVTAQYTLLLTKYQYPVSTPCTYPAFNPPASSWLPIPQEHPQLLLPLPCHIPTLLSSLLHPLLIVLQLPTGL